MNNSESRTLWISLAAGLFAAFLLYSYSQEKKAEFDKKFGVVDRVVVAAVDISEFQTIDDTMLDTVEKPKDFTEPGVYRDPSEIVGQVAAAPFKKGESILATKLLSPGPETGIALQVSPAKRAITIPIDEMRAVAKLIRPGDRVDIYAALDSGRGVNQKKQVQLLMQDVPVLATGVNVVNHIPRMIELDSSGKNITQIPLSADTKYTSITIETDPKSAQDLIFILSTSPGNLFMTLRNPNDHTPIRLAYSDADTLLGKSIPEVSSQSIPTSVAPQVAPLVQAPTRNTSPIPQQRFQQPAPTHQNQRKPANTSGFKDL